MKVVTIDFSHETPVVSTHYSGELGEHQAVTLHIIPEDNMQRDEDIAFYYVLFTVEGGLVASRTYEPGEDIDVALWGQLTEQRNFSCQLIGTNGLETIIAKSPVINLSLGKSLDGTVIGIDDNRDSLIAMIGAFNERLDDVEVQIDEIETGMLTDVYTKEAADEKFQEKAVVITEEKTGLEWYRDYYQKGIQLLYENTWGKCPIIFALYGYGVMHFIFLGYDSSDTSGAYGFRSSYITDEKEFGPTSTIGNIHKHTNKSLLDSMQIGIRGLIVDNKELPYKTYIENTYYDKAQVDELISGLAGLNIEIVDVLPQEGETNTIYLVSTGEDSYDEYMWISGAWEKIGNTNVDLTDYAKKSDLPTKTSDLINDSGFLDESDLTEYVKDEDLAAVAVSGSYTDLTNKPVSDTTLAVSGGFADSKTVGDKITELNNKTYDLFEPYVLDWNDTGASTNYPLGWRSGYWKDDGTIGTNVKYISSTRIRNFASETTYSHDFNGIEKVKFNLPEDVSTIVVKEWIEGSPSSTLTNRWDLTDGEELKLNPNRMYGFNIGYSADATSKLTEEYLAQIKITVYPCVPKKRKSTEFERFSVKVNLAWPDVYSTSSDNAESVSMSTVRCILALPEGYSETGKAVPAIMLSHGSGGAVQYNSWNGDKADFLSMVRTFTAAGYAVFDVDNTKGNANGFHDYGCLPLCTAYLKAWEKIKRFYNVQPGLFIYSMSMGTTAALNILKWHTTDIKAAVNSAPRPVCEMAYNNAAIGGTLQTQMREAFDLSGTSWEHDRLRGFNHVENLVVIEQKNYIFEKFPPVKVLVGGADSTFSAQVEDYYDGLANAGNYINKRTVDGVTHDDMCYLVPGSLREEVINWFNRFKD